MPTVGAVRSIYPGTRALLMGYDQVYGGPIGPSSLVDPWLDTASLFTLLAASTITNSGSSVIAGGNVGLYPGTSITGFPPGVVTPPATIQLTTPAAEQAEVDANNAYLHFQSLPAGTVESTLDGLTLTPGTYTSASSMALSGGQTLTLNGAGLYVFQIGSTLTVGVGATVALTGGATATNVIWQVGSSATIDGPGTTMVGTIIALDSVTLGGGTLNGRALALTAAVTIATAEDATSPQTGPGVGPTAENLPGNAASVPIVIAPRTPNQNSLRTVVWRAFPAGATVDLAFQVSIDANPLNFVTVDTYSGTGNSGNREIQADQVTGAQSAAMSSARFCRVLNLSGTAVSSLIVDFTAQ